MLDGIGSPESADFGRAVRRLYAATGSADLPLEGLWTQDGRDDFELSSDKDTWRWTLVLPAGENPDTSRLPGRHHEIYLDDPQTCPPAELRTIIRQTVQ